MVVLKCLFMGVFFGTGQLFISWIVSLLEAPVYFNYFFGFSLGVLLYVYSYTNSKQAQELQEREGNIEKLEHQTDNLKQKLSKAKEENISLYDKKQELKNKNKKLKEKVEDLKTEDNPTGIDI